MLGESTLWNYFKNLFFQDVKKDNSSDVAYCEMHDFATLMAGIASTMLTSSEEYIGHKVRHVFFHPVYSLRNEDTNNSCS